MSASFPAATRASTAPDSLPFSFDEPPPQWSLLYQNYTHQLTRGCGDGSCQQPFCATARKSQASAPLSPTVARAFALRLATQGSTALLCLRYRKRFDRNQAATLQTNGLLVDPQAEQATPGCLLPTLDNSSGAQSSHALAQWCSAWLNPLWSSLSTKTPLLCPAGDGSVAGPPVDQQPTNNSFVLSLFSAKTGLDPLPIEPSPEPAAQGPTATRSRSNELDTAVGNPSTAVSIFSSDSPQPCFTHLTPELLVAFAEYLTENPLASSQSVAPTTVPSPKCASPIASGIIPRSSSQPWLSHLTTAVSVTPQLPDEHETLSSRGSLYPQGDVDPYDGGIRPSLVQSPSTQLLQSFFREATSPTHSHDDDDHFNDRTAPPHMPSWYPARFQRGLVGSSRISSPLPDPTLSNLRLSGINNRPVVRPGSANSVEQPQDSGSTTDSEIPIPWEASASPPDLGPADLPGSSTSLDSFSRYVAVSTDHPTPYWRDPLIHAPTPVNPSSRGLGKSAAASDAAAHAVLFPRKVSSDMVGPLDDSVPTATSPATEDPCIDGPQIHRSLWYVFSSYPTLVTGLSRPGTENFLESCGLTAHAHHDRSWMDIPTPNSVANLDMDIGYVQRIYRLVLDLPGPHTTQMVTDALRISLLDMDRAIARLSKVPIIVENNLAQDSWPYQWEDTAAKPTQAPQCGPLTPWRDFLCLLKALFAVWECPLLELPLYSRRYTKDCTPEHWDLLRQLITLTVRLRTIHLQGDCFRFMAPTSGRVRGLDLYALWLGRGACPTDPMPPGPNQSERRAMDEINAKEAFSQDTRYQHHNTLPTADHQLRAALSRHTSLLSNTRVQFVRRYLLTRLAPYLPDKIMHVDPHTQDILDLLMTWWQIAQTITLSAKGYPLPSSLTSLSFAMGLATLGHDPNLEHRVASRAFVSKDLCSRLDIRHEVRLWRRKHGRIDKAREIFTQRFLRSVCNFSLLDYPYLFAMETKAQVFRADALLEMTHHYELALNNVGNLNSLRRLLREEDFAHACFRVNRKDDSEPNGPLISDASTPYLVLELCRESLAMDALFQLQRQRRHLRQPLKVRFVNGGEVGFDQGGVQKELLRTLVETLLRSYDPCASQWAEDGETRWFWPRSEFGTTEYLGRFNGVVADPTESPSSKDSATLSVFELFGVVLGLALYNNIHIPLAFPLVFYKKLLGDTKGVGFADLRDGFPALARGLQALLDWSDGDVEYAFGFTFEITVESLTRPGCQVAVPLLPGGDQIPVTNANRQQYVDLYADFVLNRAVEGQFAAIRQGLLRVVDRRLLALCGPLELERLMVGEQELDFAELERTAAYEDHFHARHPCIRRFWNVVHTFTPEQKRKLLLFVTANDRLPIGGFRAMTFVIQRNGPDSDRLPTALTCFGRLLLPEYRHQAKLRDRLLTAIENTQGFGLA
ncbi:hypothetical protein H4R34_003410 [Dimargaris verticillata]|uniref:HECT-type E3 ubiquitin transferase n=1 Tax=Dimargaris verticillata TaxID=2761393 RepID=A0A9W8ECN3_9FUNG|nr:hypothetical protein H4R34_003410 [Dimargaris verticillata]